MVVHISDVSKHRYKTGLHFQLWSIQQWTDPTYKYCVFIQSLIYQIPLLLSSTPSPFHLPIKTVVTNRVIHSLCTGKQINKDNLQFINCTTVPPTATSSPSIMAPSPMTLKMAVEQLVELCPPCYDYFSKPRNSGCGYSYHVMNFLPLKFSCLN